MSNERFDVSRRKALAALGTIGVASAGAGLGTSAYFSDQETFENNRLVAGTLDMGVSYSAHYSDWSDDEDGGVPNVRMWDGPAGTTGSAGDLEGEEVGLPANDAWLIAVSDDEDDGEPDTDVAAQFLENTQYQSFNDGGLDCIDGEANSQADDAEAPVIDLNDVKPGDFGEVTFDFVLCDNPGFVWINGNLRDASENGLTEPEADDPDEGDGVELLDVVQAAVWVDDGGDGPGGEEDGNNFQNGDEEPLVSGSLRDILGMDLPDSNGAALNGDLPAEAGGGMSDRNCFSAGTQHSVVFAWWVPVDHGNEIQSDSATFDLGLYTEQCRHNDGSGMPPEIAQVEMDDQESDGTTVTVDSVALPRDGYVAIHDARLFDGQAVPSVIGVSDYLTAGFYQDVQITLFSGVPGQLQSNFDASPFPDDDATLVSMPHEETDGNQTYNFITSGGGEDVPFFDGDGNVVVDPATVTVD